MIQSRAEQSRAEQSRAEQSRAEQSRAEQSRDNYIDLLKGLTISLVVFGHCMQYGSGTAFFTQEAYFDNIVFRSIYSFHMPMFALISGFLFCYSYSRRSLTEILMKQVRSLLIPALCWPMTFQLLRFFAKLCLGRFEWADLRELPNASLSLWFLWTLFACSLMVILIEKAFKGSLKAHGILFALALFLPDVPNLRYFLFLYPFFLTGFLWNQKKVALRISAIGNRKKLCGAISICALWGLLVCHYNYNTYIYTTGARLYGANICKQLAIDLERWLTGFCGCAAFSLIVYRCKFMADRKIGRMLIAFGRETLCIYALGMYANQLLLKVFASSGALNYLCAFAQAAAVLVFSYGVSLCMKRFQLTRMLYLGGR